MKKLLIFCLIATIFHLNSYADIFYLKYYDGRVTRTVAYSIVVVKNNNGVIIFTGKTDKYGRVKIINTSGKSIQVTYNRRTYIKKPITIKNNDQRTTITFGNN